MRKLLILSKQSQYNADDLENYLYDTEASRDAFLEMSAKNIQSGKLKDISWHYSEWDLAHKDDVNVDYLHVVHCGEEVFVFENEYLANITKFYKAFTGTKSTITAVIHKERRTIIIVRLNKDISNLVSKSIAILLEHFDNETYSEDIARTIGLPWNFITEEPEIVKT